MCAQIRRSLSSCPVALSRCCGYPRVAHYPHVRVRVYRGSLTRHPYPHPRGFIPAPAAGLPDPCYGLATTSVVSSDQASKDTMRLGIQSTELLEDVCILFGLCTNTSTSEERLYHWAWAEQRHSATWGQPLAEYVHDCTTDHIANWPNGTREFVDTERTIRLVFTPCTHAPERTLVLGLELSGSRYEQIQKNANIRLPPPTRSMHRPADAPVRGGFPRSTTGHLKRSTSPPSDQPVSVPKFFAIVPNTDRH